MNNNFKTIIFSGVTVVLSFIILFVFYGELLPKTDSVLFSRGGDGLKSYYASHYHIKYDEDYLHTKCMNYPYGEFSFYSDSQPLTTNIIKFFQQYGFFKDVNIIYIINSLMLYALLLASLILFLLLRRLKLPIFYSIIVANIIVYMSPQLDRMSGHYSLSYVLFIPLFLYLFLSFIQKKSYLTSVLIGITTFIALITHGYYFAFFAFFAFFIPIFYSIQTKSKLNILKEFLPHIFIQIALPFVLFQLFSHGIPTDRTSYPWGFFATRAFPESVFLPVGKPYFGFLHIPYLKWEGMAYIGLVSVIVFLAIVYQTITRKRDFKLINNPFLSAALLTSIIALLFSFAYPFTWNLQWLWNYMGPLKQFRASGRFTWLFFYVMNITAYYIIWNWYSKNKSKKALIILSLALLMGSYDAILNARHKEDRLQNRIESIFDKNNELSSDEWINSLDVDKFQTIMPLPYFHVGSEVYWINGAAESREAAFSISWKTGLPINAVLMSRTSIKQTMSNLALYFEPNRAYDIIDDYLPNKDILLIAANGLELSKNEQRFIDYATLVTKTNKYNAYSLSVDAIKSLNSDYRNNIIKAAYDSSLYAINGYLLKDSIDGVIFESFGNKYPNLDRNSTAKFDATAHNVIIDIPMFEDSNAIIISFWIKDMDKDILPRSSIKIGTKVKDGNLEQKIKDIAFRKMKYVDEDGWGLVEFEYQPKAAGEELRLEIWNDLTISGEFEIDNLLLRKKSTDVYYIGKDFIFWNNRFIKQQK